MIVYCSACTCVFNSEGKCTKESIRLEDFEYYKDAEGKRRDYLEDDMKCASYESIYVLADTLNFC